MSRKFTTDFQYGSIEVQTNVTPNGDSAPLPESIVDEVHRSVITPIINQLFVGVSTLVVALELKKDGQHSTNVTVPVVAQVAGYTCRARIQLDVEVQLSKTVLEAAVLNYVAPSFLQDAARLIATYTLRVAMQNSGYSDLLSQKLVNLLSPPAAAPESFGGTGGMYL